MNDAVTQFGHGRVVHGDGETQDIGGSTVGGSRRAIDDWMAPGWRQFLADEFDWGEAQAIGGSTGGGSRRAIGDLWPDRRQFLAYEFDWSEVD